MGRHLVYIINASSVMQKFANRECVPAITEIASTLSVGELKKNISFIAPAWFSVVNIIRFGAIYSFHVNLSSSIRGVLTTYVFEAVASDQHESDEEEESLDVEKVLPDAK